MSIRKHKKLMFKLKYTSSLVVQKEKEILELQARIDRGNGFIMKTQRLLFEQSQVLLLHQEGQVKIVLGHHLGRIPKENQIKF